MKKKRRPPQIEFENNPTPERLKHAGIEADTFTTDSRRKVKRLGSILDSMLNRSAIDGPLHRAGVTVYSLWYYGGLAPVGAIDYSKTRVDGATGDPMQRRMDCARRFTDAIRTLSKAERLAFEQLVLFEMSPAEFGTRFYGYNDQAQSRAIAYAILKNALEVFDLHLNSRLQ